MITPDWSQVIADLMIAVDSSRHAYARTRRRKAKLSADESRRVLAFNREIEKYMRDGRSAIASATAEGTHVEWRPVVLNLLRAHSMVWERLRIEHDQGIPDHVETGQAIDGRDPRADSFIAQAFEALAATEPRLEYVTWDGREVLKM